MPIPADDQMVQQTNIDQGEGATQLKGDPAICFARLRDARGVVVSDNQFSRPGESREVQNRL